MRCGKECGMGLKMELDVRRRIWDGMWDEVGCGQHLGWDGMGDGMWDGKRVGLGRWDVT